MMYNQKMILAVKSNGKILREFKDIVRIPFGSEYSLLIKNIHNKRAQVSVSIDGQDVLNGRALIVNANSETELTRSVRDNNLYAGNTFKFIERTAGVEQHRGIKLDDGIIRITFKFEVDRPVYERPKTPITWNRGGYYKGTPNRSMLGGDVNMANGGTLRSMSFDGHSGYAAMDGMLGVAHAQSASAAAVSDVGITVPGSISNQTFTEVSHFQTEWEEHVMVLRLSGVVEGQAITQPITVKTKPVCQTCGEVAHKFDVKFCAACGTSLQIV